MGVSVKIKKTAACLLGIASFLVSTTISGPAVASDGPITPAVSGSEETAATVPDGVGSSYFPVFNDEGVAKVHQAGITENGATTFETDTGSLAVLPASGPEPTNLAALAPSIRCSLNVQNVHASSHVSGTINGVARIDCNGPAGQLQIHYSLIRLSPATQWGGPSKTNGGYSSIQTNRAVPCDQGPAQFRGWAQGMIAPPPGYTLSGPASTNAYGNITGVACGGITRSTQDSADEVISVTFVRDDLL